MSEDRSDVNVPNRRPLTDGLQELLRRETARPIGITEAPVYVESESVPTGKEVGDTKELPYVVIHPTRGTTFFGPGLAFPEADATYAYSIHSFGLRPDQTEAMADRVKQAIMGRDRYGDYVAVLNAAGLTVMMRTYYEDQSPGQLQNEGKIYYVVDSYLISVTTS